MSGKLLGSAMSSTDTSGQIHAVRPYAFRYALGVLWMLAFGSVFVKREHLLEWARLIQDISRESGAGENPELLLGFVLITVGVIVPFSLALAFHPLSYVISDALFRWLTPRINRRDLRNDIQLQGLAANVVLRRAQAPPSAVYDHTKLMLVISENPAAGSDLQSKFDEAIFRAQSIFPTSILVAATTWHGLDTTMTATIGAFCTGATLFVIGMWYSIVVGHRWRRQLNSAVLLYCAGAAEMGDYSTPAPSEGRGLTSR
jgi:hypothetical protein